MGEAHVCPRAAQVVMKDVGGHRPVQLRLGWAVHEARVCARPRAPRRR